MFRWQIHRSESGDCGMSSRSRDFDHNRRCKASLATRGPVSSPSLDAQKNTVGSCGRARMGWYDRTVRGCASFVRRHAGILEFAVRRVACRACGVKRERLAFLADNPLYTKRFAYFVGRRCRQSARLPSIGAGCSDASKGGSSPCSLSLRVAPVPLRAFDPSSAPCDPGRRSVPRNGPFSLTKEC